MSRAFDAKQTAVLAYPDDKESGIELFLSYLGISEDDFVFEFGQTAEEYIYTN
jgi:hypothetical protein